MLVSGQSISRNPTGAGNSARWVVVLNAATRTTAALALVIAGWAAPATAQTTEPSIKLSPGSTFSVTFPDLPPTFADLLNHNGVKPRMTVFLPGNYDPARQHPLLIFLQGGDGGSGANPGVARKLTKERDFICVSLPLFKETLNPPAPGNGTSRILIRSNDARYM
jgi:hypothetical protein